MFGFSDREKECKCCLALKNENAFLRGLVDRFLVNIAPPVLQDETPVKDSEAAEDIPEDVISRDKYGD